MFLNRYRKFIKPEGILRLKTDSTFLYDFTREVIAEEKLEVLVDSDDIYNKLCPEQPDSQLTKELAIKTYYEKKWLEMGKLIKYLEYKL